MAAPQACQSVAVAHRPEAVNRFALTDPLDEARTAISRRILVVATVVFALGALLLATGPFPIPFRAALVACFAVAALLRDTLVATLDARRAAQAHAL